MADVLKILAVVLGVVIIYGFGFSDGASYERSIPSSESAKELPSRSGRVIYLKRSTRAQR